VVVDDPARLHRRVRRRRADEAQAAPLELARERAALGRARRQVAQRARRRRRPLRRERPHELGEVDAGLAQRDDGARVRDRRLDLGAVAHDARVGEQPRDVVVAEGGDARGVEVAEGGAERRPLAQDRQPGQARLERLEADPLEDAPLVADGDAPLLVVVAGVERVAVAEAAHGPGP